MFSQRAALRFGIPAGILGLVLIVFGSVWIASVFSHFEKIPSDWDQIDDLQGTFVLVDEAFLARLQGNETVNQLRAAPGGLSLLEDPVVQAILGDQTFLGRLQGNATIGQLLSTPGSLDLLADPAVQSVLGNPAVAQMVSNPQLLALLQNPSALQALANPTLLDLLSNPEVLALLGDQEFVALLLNPAALPQLLAHPVAGPLLSDPDVVSLFQDTAFQAVLRSGALSTLAAQPELLELLLDPSLGAVVTNPAVQPLLADPEALSLVLDTRTQQALANPSITALLADPEALSLILDSRTQRLLANPADLPTIEGEVVIHRVRRATGTAGNRIFINEQKTYLDPATGEEIPYFPMENHDLIVDRKSKEYLPGTAEGRTGFWGLPFDVDKDRDYDSWVTAARQPQPARYLNTEKLQGLETFLFVQDVDDLDLGIDEPTGLPVVVDADIKAWVEPKTGSIVKIEDRDVVSALDSSGNKHTLVEFDVKHTEATLAELIDEAKSNRSKIVWFGTNMPWISIGLGILLIGASAAVVALAAGRGREEG